MARPISKESEDHCADLIRQWRTLRGWSQRELAYQSSTSESSVNRWEVSCASLDIPSAARIFAALNIPEDAWQSALWRMIEDAKHPPGKAKRPTAPEGTIGRVKDAVISRGFQTSRPPGQVNQIRGIA